jgi:UDP-N-acetylglucosamine:LPS N-acetylglucosamine transferase
MKICYAASSGGHLEEILSLSKLNTLYDSFFITEKTQYAVDCGKTKVYFFEQVNRKDKFLFAKLALIFCKAFFVFFREKPDIIISTGALMAVPVCFAGKLMKKKIIYIESIARVKSASVAGKLIYHFADLFIVQWENLKKVYPRAVCGGKII